MLLCLCCSVNPGDEVILFDPYFVMYRHLVTLAGGTSVIIDTYPDFRIDAKRVAAAMTSKTKAVLVNTPANPTGVVASAGELKALADEGEIDGDDLEFIERVDELTGNGGEATLLSVADARRVDELYRALRG